MAARPLSDDLIPVKRPHFTLRGDELFFLLSTRPHMRLDPADLALWNAIDGVASIGVLRAIADDAGARLQTLREYNVCELAEPSFPADRRKILVVETHMDDAVLSVGGAMWASRMTCEFTVVTIGGRSNYTSYWDLDRDLFDVERVSALRRAESVLAMRMAGGRHVSLDEPEAPLRLRPGNWTLAWYRRHRQLVEAFIGHASPQREVDVWAARLERLFRETDADEIWLPLGVGSHTDHELARNAWVSALQRSSVTAPIWLYQDVPYASQFPEHTDAIVAALRDGGAEIEPRGEDISAVLADKHRLVSIFGSQFKPSYMAPRVEESARRVGGAELRFHLKRLPRAIDPLTTYSRRAAVEHVVATMKPWYARHRLAPRIRVLTPVPVARWTDDMAFILDAFPNATLEVHVSSEYADETAALTSPRLDVRIVHGREIAWLGWLALLGATRTPTIVLTGEGLAPLSWAVRAWLFRSDVVTATRMNDVVLALGSVVSQPRNATAL